MMPDHLHTDEIAMDIRTRLDELESRIPHFIAASDGDLEAALQCFAGEADEICEVADADEWPYVSGRLDAMLAKHGIGEDQPRSNMKSNATMSQREWLEEFMCEMLYAQAEKTYGTLNTTESVLAIGRATILFGQGLLPADAVKKAIELARLAGPDEIAEAERSKLRSRAEFEEARRRAYEAESRKGASKE